MEHDRKKGYGGDFRRAGTFFKGGKYVSGGKVRGS